MPGGYTEIGHKPKRNPDAFRWCHMDVGLSGDSCGFAIGHIERWVEVVRRTPDGVKYTDTAPYYIIDVMLRINPPPGEQIYLPDLRAMLYQFMEHGYKFIGFSCDKFAWVEMHQQVKRHGITPHLLSTDESTAPYDELKSAFYENRIEIYRYEPFIHEFLHLEYDRVAGKIDHPTAGGKDQSDAVAGIVGSLLQHSRTSPIEGMQYKKQQVPSEHAWVTPLIPMDKVDFNEIRSNNESKEDFLPIIFGD